MKKLIKLSQTEICEMSYEELLVRYEPYINKQCHLFRQLALRRLPQFEYLYDHDDFKQEAIMSIKKAFDRYNIDYNILFYTYMKSTVEGSLKRFCRDVTQSRRYSPEEMNVISFDKRINNGENKETTLLDIYSNNKSIDAKNDIDTFIDKDMINDALSILTDKEKYIINNIYFKDKVQRVIGKELNMSQIRISRTQKRALNKMKNYLDKENIVILHEENKTIKPKPKPKPKQKSIKKEDDFMKLNLDDLIHYLEHNIDKNVLILKQIDEYASKKSLDTSTILTELSAHKKNEYEALKLLYKNTHSIAAHEKENKCHKSYFVKTKEGIGKLGIQENISKTINRNIEKTNCKTTEFKVQPPSTMDLLKNVKINSLTIDLDKITASIDGKGTIKLLNLELEDLTLLELKTIKEDLVKIIAIAESMN